MTENLAQKHRETHKVFVMIRFYKIDINYLGFSESSEKFDFFSPKLKKKYSLF